MKYFFVAVFFALFLFPAHVSWPKPPGRFVYEGNGEISLARVHSKRRLNVQYRKPDGTYDPRALHQINDLFGMPAKELGEGVSLRLIAMLDHLQDLFTRGQTLKVVSGYRSRVQNEHLRRKGYLAAQASYHIEGMAADLIFPEASEEKIWNYVRRLKWGGAGFYHGKTIHIDSGRPRFWTEATALPKSKKPAPNRHIYLSVDYDRYHLGEPIRMFFSGITNYPFGVRPIFRLAQKGGETVTFIPKFYGIEKPQDEKCIPINERKEARLIFWEIPPNITLASERSSIQVTFCGPTYPTMPSRTVSRPFQILE